MALTITAILLSVQLFFIRPYYLVNDDLFKVLLARGVGWDMATTPYFLSSNVLLGYVFTKLYVWFPKLPWYPIFLLAVQALCYWSLLWALFLKPFRKFSTILFILSFAATQFIFFAFFQFTIASILSGTTGLLLWGLSNEPIFERKIHWFWVLSGILLTSSWLIRANGAELAFLAVLPFLFFIIRRTGFRPFFQRQWKFMLAVGSIILLASVFEFAWYANHSDWKDFLFFMSKAKKLQQYYSESYSAGTKQIFDSVGWSANDLWMFQNWYWMDLPKFSLEHIQKLLEQLPRNVWGHKINSFDSLFDIFSSYWDQRMLVYFLLFCFFCGRNMSKFLLAQALWIMLIFSLLLIYMKAIDRVTLPLLAYLINLIVLYAEPPVLLAKGQGSFARYALDRSRLLLLILGFVCIYPAARLYYRQNQERRAVEANVRECLKELKPMPQQLYVMWGFQFELFRVFDNYDCFKPIHMFATSFIQRSPIYDRTLKGLASKNIFLDMVDNPNILMICNPQQGAHYHDYIKENFHKEIYARKVYECPYFKVFTIHSKKAS